MHADCVHSVAERLAEWRDGRYDSTGRPAMGVGHPPTGLRTRPLSNCRGPHWRRHNVRPPVTKDTCPS